MRVCLLMLLVTTTIGCDPKPPISTTPTAVPVMSDGSGSGSTPAPTPTAGSAAAESEAHGFAMKMLDAIEHDDLVAWRDLQSVRIRTRTAEPAALRGQLDAWKQSYLPKLAVLRAATYTLEGTSVKVSVDGKLHGFATVINESGALHLDEN